MDIVLHVHDEIVVEVPIEDAHAALELMRAAMNNPQPWAKDFPLSADPAVMRRYGK